MLGAGTLVNTAAIIAGGLVGSFAIPKIPERIRHSVMQALGAGVIVIGLKMAWDSRDAMLMLLSLAMGTLLGELLHIHERLHGLALHLERFVGQDRGGFAQAFVQTTLLFCVGAMAITGALQDGLNGDPRILYVKAVLDGTGALMFASTMGPGVMLAAIPVLVYQGVITLGAGVLSRVLSEPMIHEMGTVGGVLVMVLGLNMTGATALRVANMLPGMFLVALLVWLNPFAFLGL